MRGQLDRIARLAARMLDSPAAIVCRDVDDEFVCAGAFGSEATLRRHIGLFPHLRAYHAGGDDRLVLIPTGSSPLPKDSVPLATAGIQSLISVAVRSADGDLLGCILATDPAVRDWGATESDELADMARLAGNCLQHEERVKQTSWLEEAVRIQSAYLDQLFEESTEAIAVLDDRSRIIRVNPQYTRMFGYTPEEAIGRTPAELTIPAEGLEEARSFGRRAGRGEKVRAEVVRRRKDGSLVHVSLLSLPVRISPSQVGYYAICRDLTSEVDARQTIRQNEERFRALVENATDVIAVITQGGTIDYVTPSVESILGLSAETLIGTSAFAMLHPDDAPDVLDRFRDLLRGECGESIELRLRSEHAGWRTFAVTATNMVGDPEVTGVVVNARDITDARSAKQVQRRLNAFLESTPDFVATFDPYGRALSLNRAFRTILAIDPESTLRELTIADLFPGDVTETLLQEGIPAATREGAWSGQTRLTAHDGREIPISQVVLAHRSSSGALEFISTLARDITRQKEAESALRHSEAHFRSLIENALDIISITDAEGRVLFASPSLRKVLGYEPEEMVGQNIFSFIHPDETKAAAESFARVLREGEGEPAEFRVRHRDGSWRRLESVSENLLDDPAVGGVVVNSRDVTDRRQAEEALSESQQQLIQAQKMEAVGRLAGGIAHDFNNLLTAIKGFTELLLLDFEERDPRRAFAAEIQGAATRAAALTRQLLAFSRRQVLQPVVLDLNATVVELEKMLQRLIGEDLRMVCSLDPSLARVRADPGQIEQVLMNLVVNARDAMPTGGELRIRTSNADLTEADARAYRYVEPGTYVLLEVSDTGAGMTREIQDRIFEPFFTTKEQGKGTGLGLSTAYGIVKQSGGYIWVDSAVGSGTTFRIYLPRVDEEIVERTSEHTDPTSTEGSESVLLVEDELAVRVLVRRVLERNGYRVVEASSGAEALVMAGTSSQKIDLLLTDVVMPGMSGRELADRLAAEQPDLRILYMSGYTDEAIVHHGVLEPGVAFLEKPFTPEILLRKLREVLDATAAQTRP